MAEKPMLFSIDVDTKTGEISLKRFTGAVNDAARNVEKPASQMSDTLSKLRDGANQTGHVMEHAFSPKMLLGAAGVGVAAAAIGKLTMELFEFVGEGQKVYNIGVGFRALTKDIGVDATQAMEALTAATEGTIDKETMMVSLNKVLMRDFQLTSTQMEDLANVAVKLGKAYGKTSTEALEQFTEAVSRGNPRMLKKIGIMIDAEKALDDYAKSLGLVSTLLDEDQKRQAIMNASLEYGKQKVANMEFATGSLAIRLKQASVEFTNFRHEVAEWISQIGSTNKEDAMFRMPLHIEMPKALTAEQKEALRKVIEDGAASSNASLPEFMFGPADKQYGQWVAYLKKAGMSQEGIDEIMRQRQMKPFEIKIPEDPNAQIKGLRKVAGLLSPEDVQRQLDAFDIIIHGTERLRAATQKGSLDWQIYSGQIAEQAKKKRQVLIDLEILVDPQKMEEAKKAFDAVKLETDKKFSAFWADLKKRGKGTIDDWNKAVMSGESTSLRPKSDIAPNFRVPVKFQGWWDMKAEEEKAAAVAQDLADRGLIPGSTMVNFGKLGAPDFIKEMRPANVDAQAAQLAGAQEELNRQWDAGNITAQTYYEKLMLIGDAWERLLRLGGKLLPQDAAQAAATKKLTDAKKIQANVVSLVANAFASEAAAAWSAWVAGDAAALSGKKIIRAIADQAGVKAIFEVAEGFAALARYDVPAATFAFKSAAAYAAVAGAALAVSGRGEGSAGGGGGMGGGGSTSGSGGSGGPFGVSMDQMKRQSLAGSEYSPGYGAQANYANPFLEPGTGSAFAPPNMGKYEPKIYVSTMDAKSFREWASQPENRAILRDMSDGS